ERRLPRGRSAEEVRQVTRDRVAKQRQRAAAATSAPTPARPRPRAAAYKEEGPELVRPQIETVVKGPVVDEPVDSGVTHSDLAPLEDLPYAPRTSGPPPRHPMRCQDPIVAGATRRREGL